MSKKSQRMSTPCASCTTLNCRIKSKDCYGVHSASAEIFSTPTINEIAKSASGLVDNGRAGTLGRLEEVVAFCQAQGYQRIGLAYCFGLKPMAMEVCDVLRRGGLTPLPVTCSSGGLKEREIDEDKITDVVSCNPVGQALVLNQLACDLVLEMGLCLGHDIIFHETLEIPHTTILVKDRVYAHSPANHLQTHRDKNTAFLERLDTSFGMKTPAWLEEQMALEQQITVLDFRGAEVFAGGHIEGSQNLPLGELPKIVNSLTREALTVCVCNGSIQSAYAAMFLFSRGFSNVYSLSGGMSRWERENRPLKSTPTSF